MWLAVNLVIVFLALCVIGLFDEIIEQIMALATLMPIVAGLAGNSGNQTMALMIRSLTQKQVVKEITVFRIFERGETRIDDRVTEAAMEDRKKGGYF